MKKSNFLTLCFLMIMLCVPGLSFAQSKYVVTGNNVNVRSSATTKGTVVGSLSAGQTVTVMDIRNGWATISYKGKTCYVKATFLQAKQEKKAPQSHYNHSSSSNYQSSGYSSYSSNGDKGFAMSSDVMLGYSKKIFSAALGFDAGYRFNKMFYIGAGPMVEADFADGGSLFGAGAYGKARFTFPLESPVKPMIGARIGYFYNFTAESGDVFYGGEIGLNFSKRFYAGIMVTVTSNTARTTKVEKTWARTPTNSWEEKYLRGHDKVTTDSNTEYYFTPSLFFSLDF